MCPHQLRQLLLIPSQDEEGRSKRRRLEGPEVAPKGEFLGWCVQLPPPPDHAVGGKRLRAAEFNVVKEDCASSLTQIAMAAFLAQHLGLTV